ncbi:DUF2239 family protein [Aeoliella mucimassa]|uniref:DUF2239 domain-containing protein n=1 Tax=Aeoliella mucimassa TaxID=2527972 RepID=A0A518AP31_9BACT|nr:DUF2239 family protein [Aeoliella mucimassa]QDU56474.1 hypothetical protein Pan181_26830 [Aeoliella mucimassa]
MADEENTYTSFKGYQRVASGDLSSMLLETKEHIETSGEESLLIFEDTTGRQVEFDFRGTADEVLERHGAAKPRVGPGRPKLGVTAREVTLLPRQWDWLEQQPKGISATLRKLVDEARKQEPNRERARRLRDAAGKFMWAMAGNLPDFEEASRALYANDFSSLQAKISDWPTDIREHITRLLDQCAELQEAAGE